jgi:hypothetical protein
MPPKLPNKHARSSGLRLSSREEKASREWSFKHFEQAHHLLFSSILMSCHRVVTKLCPFR